MDTHKQQTTHETFTSSDFLPMDDSFYSLFKHSTDSTATSAPSQSISSNSSNGHQHLLHLHNQHQHQHQHQHHESHSPVDQVSSRSLTLKVRSVRESKKSRMNPLAPTSSPHTSPCSLYIRSSSRKITFSNGASIPIEDIQNQRYMANVRERERTKNLNDAFANLRNAIPKMPQDKLSKIQTLKLARDYIGFLNILLNSESEEVAGEGKSAPSCSYLAQGNLACAFSMWRYSSSPGQATTSSFASFSPPNSPAGTSFSPHPPTDSPASPSSSSSLPSHSASSPLFSSSSLPSNQ